MRRIPTFVWVLLPAVLGGIYALTWALWRPDLPVAELAPQEAVITMRFRNTDAMDRLAPGHDLAQRGKRTQRLARQVNVPALDGVDRARPVHAITMPFQGIGNRTLLIFGAEDGDAFEAAFNDPSLFDKGYVRHAQHLRLHGGWIAVSGQRDAVRQVGRGGLTADDRGEDMAVAVDVPRLVDEVLRLPVFPLWPDDPGRSPWPALLEDLGLAGDQLVQTSDEEAEARLTAPAFQRLGRVRAGWQVARLWVFASPARAEIELQAKSDALRTALAAARDAPTQWPPDPSRLEGRRADLRVGSAAALRALVHVLDHLGARSPGSDPTAGLATLAEALPAEGPGALLLATRVPEPWAITWSVVSTPEALEAAATAVPGIPALGEQLTLPAGATPITVIQGRQPSRPAQFARVAVDLQDAGRWEALSLGATAAETLARLPGQLAAPAPAPAASRAGFTVIATLEIDARTAPRLLGKAVESGGLLAALLPENAQTLRGVIETDGATLRVVLTRSTE